jgi:hypothetical protein
MFLFSSTVKEGFFHFGCLEFGEMAKLLKLQFKIFKYSISSKQILTKHLWKISDIFRSLVDEMKMIIGIKINYRLSFKMIIGIKINYRLSFKMRPFYQRFFVSASVNRSVPFKTFPINFFLRRVENNSESQKLK